MMAFLRWILAVPITVAAVLFALAHRENVTLMWSPFHEGVEVRLYFVAFVFLAVGFLLGALIAWMGMHNVRQDRRQQRKLIKMLEKELDAANENKHRNDPPLIGKHHE